jgi:aspartokinase
MYLRSLPFPWLMESVQHAVRQELMKRPVLVDLLDEGVLNISAIAAKISAQIAKEAGREVKLSAISMAIRRYTEAAPAKRVRWRFPKNLELSTKSQVYEIAIEKTPEIPALLKRLYKSVKRDKGEFLSLVEGTYECMIFTNQWKKQQVREALHGQRITSELDNLAYVTVNWQKGVKDIPGVYYRITRALAFRGISIQSFHTIGAEMMIFFKEDVFTDAYQTIAEVLRSSDAP